jgi:pimeloyl-ACP methyl ester carboxylesterase
MRQPVNSELKPTLLRWTREGEQVTKPSRTDTKEYGPNFEKSSLELTKAGPANTDTFRDTQGLTSLEFGDRSASSIHNVLYLHGFPGSGLEARILDSFARERCARITAFDRPGFGASLAPRLMRGTIAEIGVAIAAGMRERGIESYSIIAVSGGAPYALAVSRAAPGAVTRVVLVSGISELSHKGALAGMVTQNKVILSVGRWAPLLVRPLVHYIANGWRRNPRGMVRSLARMLDGELRRLLRRWPLDLRAIRTEVKVFHGMEDRYVPLAHGEWISKQLTNSSLTALPGRGHFMAARIAEQMLDAAIVS